MVLLITIFSFGRTFERQSLWQPRPSSEISPFNELQVLSTKVHVLPPKVGIGHERPDGEAEEHESTERAGSEVRLPALLLLRVVRAAIGCLRRQ